MPFELPSPTLLAGSLRLAEKSLHLFMRYGLAPRVLFQALANRGQVILGHRLIVQGSRVEEDPEGIRRLLTEVLQEPPPWHELWFRQLFHESMKCLAIFHKLILLDHGRRRAANLASARRAEPPSMARSVEGGMR